ncbi:uncharacterized protein GGS22DRAFT_191814 [Annulohypoxylon maeteangense]|uniref:uncharacterized protein n=1 Tax=Annulohypoxylon maeteangense TaxID=1927788 RepID=UPI0020077E87|nr:uncharacterized protein GGS22DRAFT_191814 [Annulohypoxylon maeteangense]KAI0882083.1 hypothetical protein GGS22DRAFT_191814 [Annulohypoxylon maeteangense]
MAVLSHPIASIKRSATGILQTIFTLAVITIFVVCFLVEDEAIVLPQWAKAWNGVPSDTREVYAAVLIPVVIILAVLFFLAGFALMMRERRENRTSLGSAV